MRTKELQIEAAMHDYIKLANVENINSLVFKHVSRRLLDGEYVEEPLPQIAALGAAWDDPVVGRDAGGVWRVGVNLRDCRGFSSGLYGPRATTKREAIEAWNAGLAR